MFDGIGFPELLVILVIITILFGVGKLPQVGESLGRAIRNYRRARAGEDEQEIAVAPADGIKGRKTARKSVYVKH